MGRMSVREGKNVYQLRREELGLSREKAAALFDGAISEDRIYRIETKARSPHPDEVALLAKGYRDPSLCSHYCACECPIGKGRKAEVGIGELPSIVLDTLASLNSIEAHKARLIEIAADSMVSEDESSDFVEIQAALEKVSSSIEALKLWAEQMEMEKR